MRKFFKKRSSQILNVFVLLPFLAQIFVSPIFALEEILPETQVDIPIDTSEDILDEGISDPTWIVGGDTATTNNVVVLDEVYTAPQNENVLLTFTKLPEESGYLTVTEITLTDEEVEATNAVSSTAYDITTDMVDGTYEYDLTLPTTSDDVSVVYAESREEIVSNTIEVNEELTVENGRVEIEGLEHFTVFVVVGGNDLTGDCSGVTLISTTSGDICYETIKAAVDNANDGDTIMVASGTYVLTSVIDFDTPNVSLIGIGEPTIQVSGTGYRFYITATGVTIDGFNIEKTDKTGVQDIIYVGASDITIQNNKIHGQFEIGDSDVSRAMVFTGGLSGLLITNNIIYDLRQPGYISGVTTGIISNNYVSRTKGWVVEQGNMTFSNNTWGTNADSNVYDIAILATTSPSYYTDIISMSGLNNDAFIEDQRTSPATLSIVYVDGSVTTSGDGTARSPKKTISEGITRVSEGGNIHVAEGTYNEHVVINKSLRLYGVQANVDPRPSHGGRTGVETIVDGNGSQIFRIDANNVEINGFEFIDGGGYMIEQINSHSDYVFQYNIVHDQNGDDAVKVRTCTNCLVSNNYIYDIASPGDGIGLSGGTNSAIRDNELVNQSSENAAIYVYSSTNTNITGNIVNGTTQNDGIKLGNKGGNDAGGVGGEIRNNVVSNTAQDGISVYMSNVVIDGNDISGSSSINGALYLAFEISNVSITNNKIHDNTSANGIKIGSPVNASTVTINNNQIFNNTNYGLYNFANTLLNAKSNWWGDNDNSGPHDEWSDGSIPLTNLTGNGNSVKGMVDYSSWIKVDTIIPTTTAPKMYVSHDGGATFEERTYVTKGDVVRVETEATDNLSGVNYVQFAIKNPSGGYVASYTKIYSPTTPGGNTYRFEFTIPTDGKYIDTHGLITEDIDGLIFWVRAYDNAGNYNHGNTETFTYDKTQPTISQPTMLVSRNGGAFVESSAVKPGDLIKIRTTANDSSSGIRSVEFRIQDKTTGEYVAARVFEETPVFGNTYEYIFQIPADVKYINTHSPISEAYLQLSYWVRAHDIVGNYAHGASDLFTLDMTDPSVPLNGIPDDTVIPTNNFDFNWDSSSDITPVTYEFQSSLNPAQVNGVLTTGLWESGTLSSNMIHSSGAPDGKWYWQVRAVDSAGNRSSWSEIWDVTIDTVAPIVEITFPNDGDLLNGTVDISGYVTDANLSHYNIAIYPGGVDVNDFSLRIEQNTEYTSEFSEKTLYTWDTTNGNFPDGEYQIRLAARDLAGNRELNGASEKIITVVVDNTSPITTFTTPTSDQIFGSSIYISGQSIDTNNVKGVNLSYKLLGDTNWTPIDTGTELENLSLTNIFNWNYTWTPPIDGTYEIKASAYDTLGNTKNSPTVTGIIYDTIQPTVGNIGILIDYAGKYVNGLSGFAAGAIVLDTLSGINGNSCEYTLNNGSSWNLGNYNSLTKTCSFHLGQLSDAETLSMNVRISDNAGNLTEGVMKERKVDTNLPTATVDITNSFYGPNTFTSGTIKGTSTDTVSPITATKIRLQRSTDNKYWNNTSIFNWTTLPLVFHNATGTDNWEYNGPFPNFSNGITYIVTPFAWDEVHSLPGTGLTDSFTWDEEAPLVTNISILVNSISTVWAKEGDVLTITANVEDSLSGVLAVSADFGYNSTYDKSISMHNIGGNIYQATYTIPAGWNEGPLYITVAARDNVQNYIPNRNLAQVITIDNTDPDSPVVLGFLNPDLACGATTNQTMITIDWSEPDGTGSPIVKYQYQISYPKLDGTRGLWTTYFTTSYYRGALNQGDGPHYIRVKAQDAAGNWSEWSSETIEDACYIISDKNAPTILQEPSDDELFLNEGDLIPNVTANFFDNLGLSEVHYNLTNSVLGWDFSDSESITGTTDSLSISALVRDYATTQFRQDITTVDTFYMPEGTYIITYNAEDLGTNPSMTKTLTIHISNVSPAVDSFTADVLSITEGDTVNFEAMFSDPSYIEYISGEKHADDADWIYSFSPEGTYEPELSASIPGETLSFTHTYNTQGTYTATFKVCEDSLAEGEGECSTKDLEITVSNNIPTVTITPTTSEVTQGSPAVVLSTTVTNGNAPYTYLWSGDCTGDTPTTTVSTATVGTFTCNVQVTDTDGDIATSQATVTVGAVGGVTDENTTTSTSTTKSLTYTYGDGTGNGGEEEEENNEEEEKSTQEEEVLGETTCDTTHKISGTVFYDKNDDGLKDENEKGVEGIDVNIYDSEGTLVKTVTTDEEGNWEAYLCPGEYTTQVEGAEDQSFVLGDSDTTLNISVEKKTKWWLIVLIVSAVLILLGVLVDRYKKKKENILQ